MNLNQALKIMEKINFEEGDRFNCYFHNGKMYIEERLIKIQGGYKNGK